MFYEGDKLVAVDSYQMEDGTSSLTVGRSYQIDIVHYKGLSFSITGDDGIEIVVGFEEAKEIFDIDNIIEAE